MRLTFGDCDLSAFEKEEGVAPKNRGKDNGTKLTAKLDIFLRAVIAHCCCVICRFYGRRTGLLNRRKKT